VNSISKIATFFRAAIALRSLNLLGLPIISKKLCPGVPTNRTLYNEFILWIKALSLPSARWIIDVGANHGDFAQAASAVFPDAKVLLIEPLPSLQSELKDRSTSHGGRWFLENCAAGQYAGTDKLEIDPRDDSIGSLAGFSEEYCRANPSATVGGTVICNVKPLDQILAEREIKSVDLIKIDVEGFEFEVLQGLEKSLSAVQSIIVEVSLARQAIEGMDPLASMIRRLTESGFAIVAVKPSLYASGNEWQPVEFNILARRPN
jgi:FkbM family methyltransferase